MISIIIPTANRPEMLRTALRSIAAQTALSRIEEIIVSENVADKGSSQVCAEFAQLPIRYILREPSLPQQAHWMALATAPLKGELVAVLHDDDWWDRHHLALAIEAMENHPPAAAYYASTFFVTGESSILSSFENLAFWFGAAYPPLNSLWELNREEVALATLINTPGLYSTLVTRREALKKATDACSMDNPYDKDRMLTFALSSLGSILFQPTPQVYIRVHSHQDTFSFSDSTRKDHACATTDWIISSYGTGWDKILDAFAERIAKCPSAAWPTLRHYVMKPWCLPLLVQRADNSSRIAKLYDSIRPKNVGLKRFFRQTLPPFIFETVAHLGRMMKKP